MVLLCQICPSLVNPIEFFKLMIDLECEHLLEKVWHLTKFGIKELADFFSGEEFKTSLRV